MINTQTHLHPWHEGEKTLQKLYNVPEYALQQMQSFIRPQMSRQHQDFFSKLSYVCLSFVDSQGRPWASLLSGEEGFINVKSANVIEIKTFVNVVDPIWLFLFNDNEEEV